MSVSLGAGACPPEYVALAHELADAAGAVVRRYFRQPFAVGDKADATPVTIADREAEAAMRAILADRLPDHGILGEEHGSTRLDAEYVWVLDPIDGTKSFITGKPLFGTLVALARGGRPILGVIDQPILGERWAANLGSGSAMNGLAIATSATQAPAAAIVLASAPTMFAGANRQGYERLAGACKGAFFGGDCYNYGMLAMGFVDLVVEAAMKPYDWAALVPVVELAGGVMSDWSGRALGLDGGDGTVIAAATPSLHRAALNLLRPHN